MSYDVDHSSSGTIYEYNVSHDNEGGFFLLCPYDKPTTNFTIRYNLSVNDRARVIQVCPGNLVGGKFYKNTIVLGEGISSSIVTAPVGQNLKLDVLFTNNIIRKVGSGKGTWQLDSPLFKIDNNILYGAIDTYPGATNTNTGAPYLAAPGVRDPNGYLLLAGSPAFNTAVSVNGDASNDFFGNPTSKNLGFYSGGVTQEPQWISNFDQGTTSGWSTATKVSVVADPAGDLGKSVRIDAGGQLTRTYQSSPTGVRFDIALLFTSAGGGAATVQVGKYLVTFSNLTAADVGYWHILEVSIGKDGNARSLVDGNPVQVEVHSSGSGNSVVVSAGDSPLFVDDAFITSL